MAEELTISLEWDAANRDLQRSHQLLESELERWTHFTKTELKVIRVALQAFDARRARNSFGVGGGSKGRDGALVANENLKAIENPAARIEALNLRTDLILQQRGIVTASSQQLFDAIEMAEKQLGYTYKSVRGSR